MGDRDFQEVHSIFLVLFHCVRRNRKKEMMLHVCGSRVLLSFFSVTERLLYRRLESVGNLDARCSSFTFAFLSVYLFA